MAENMKKLAEIQSQTQAIEEETSEHDGAFTLNERMDPS